jgi:hypothetical protein
VPAQVSGGLRLGGLYLTGLRIYRPVGAMIPLVRGCPDWSGPSLIQSSPRDFWTGIGPVQISAGLVRAWTGPVHWGGISPMSLAVIHTLSHLIESYKRRHIRRLIHDYSFATCHQAADCDWYIVLKL